MAKKVEFKPRHGWRAFIGEVGIIVLGVLIALSAQQAVEAWQWRQQLKQTDVAFKSEFETAIQNAYVRLAIEPCLNQRLTEIEAKLNEPGENWRGMDEKLNFPPSRLGPPSAAPYHNYVPAPPIVTDAWNNALASGTINHLPYLKASYLADAYEAARRLKDDMRLEGMKVPSLAPLATDRKLTSDNRIAMLQSLRELYHFDGMIADDSEAVLFTVKATGLGYTDDLIRSVSAGLVDLARTARGKCVIEPEIPPSV
jgi:hypothetical protein